MNRRSFFTKLGLVAASFAILPSAATYARNWKPASATSFMLVPNPDWEAAGFEMSFAWHPLAFESIGANVYSMKAAEQFFAKRFDVREGKRIWVEPYLKIPVDHFGFAS